MNPHPNEILVETIPVGTTEGVVSVEVYHAMTMNTPTERGYRLVRVDTGEERAMTTPRTSPTPGPLLRKQIAQQFVYGDDR